MTEPADDGRRRWMASAVVVAVLALAGLASTLLPHLAAHSSPSASPPTGTSPTGTSPQPIHVALPRPHTIVRDGTVYTMGLTPPMGAERDARSPNAVRLLVDEEYNANQPLCNSITPGARIVHADDRSVTIAAFAYRRRADTSGTISCSYSVAGTRPAKNYTSLVIRLGRPLGNRTLIDARTGEPIGLISMSERPHPAYLPDGYVHSMTQSFGESGVLLAIAQYRRGDDVIEIRFRSRTAWGLDGNVIGQGTVHGVTATITDESYERCVSWSDPPGLVREVCSSAKPDFLPGSELLKVANGLRY